MLHSQKKPHLPQNVLTGTKLCTVLTLLVLNIDATEPVQWRKNHTSSSKPHTFRGEGRKENCHCKPSAFLLLGFYLKVKLFLKCTQLIWEETQAQPHDDAKKSHIKSLFFYWPNHRLGISLRFRPYSQKIPHENNKKQTITLCVCVWFGFCFKSGAVETEFPWQTAFSLSSLLVATLFRLPNNTTLGTGNQKRKPAVSFHYSPRGRGATKTS